MSGEDLVSIEVAIRERIGKSGVVEDTLPLSSELGVPHETLVRVVKSLESTDTVSSEVLASKVLVATDLGTETARAGAPEFLALAVVPEGPEGLSVAEIKARGLEDGYRVCMRNGWLRAEKRGDPAKAEEEAAEGGEGEDKGGKKKKKKDDVPVFAVRTPAGASPGEDAARTQMTTFISSNGDPGSLPAAALKDLKKRKMVAEKTQKSFKLLPGSNFSVERVELQSDITSDMMASGAWREATFKPYNFRAMGRPGPIGHLHPLMKVRTAYRQVFLEMGYEEMPTNNYVESSFWNFDSLFQPQQHPARDSHDTFFLKDPPALEAPEDYVKRVHEMHQNGGQAGGYESTGWRYEWSREEAATTLLRTHTTACSARMLYKVAQEMSGQEDGAPFRPRRFFSIDRVFRNETPDATHLAEFHQIEGVVFCEKPSLGDLIGTVQAFFKKIGMEKLRFKPAYNPYTEPSMEIFAYHEGLGKWTEVGNSGVFRPEMLGPMGLPDGVGCIAWGISLERPTMIRYAIPNIRALVGPKVDLGFVRGAPMFRL